MICRYHKSIDNTLIAHPDQYSAVAGLLPSSPTTLHRCTIMGPVLDLLTEACRETPDPRKLTFTPDIRKSARLHARAHNDQGGGERRRACDLRVSGAGTIFEMYYI